MISISVFGEHPFEISKLLFSNLPTLKTAQTPVVPFPQLDLESFSLQKQVELMYGTSLINLISLQ